DLLVQHWQDTELAEMVAPYRGMAPYESTGSLQAALDAARAREPDTKVRFIAFPGTSFSSPHHFGVFMRGDEPLTSRMSKPVLVDALTAEVTDSRDPPWYLAALMLSRPLHFGDYGGMPLQVIWAILDMLTILVLGSGLYLWLARGARAGKGRGGSGGRAPRRAGASSRPAARCDERAAPVRPPVGRPHPLRPAERGRPRVRAARGRPLGLGLLDRPGIRLRGLRLV